MAPREIKELRVPAECFVKLAAKGITIDEVRQAVTNATSVRRGPKNTRPDQQGRCYFIVAPTDAGRTLKVLVRRFSGGAAMLITAWDPNTA
jgi:hypothetical protein